VSRKEFADLREQFSEKSVSDLLRLLESEALATRFIAEMCLRDTMGT